MPKARVGFKPREIGSYPISGCHLSGDRAGHSCRPGKASHKKLTNWLSVAEGFTAQQSPPAVQWLQVLGHLVSLEKLVPYGRIRIHPIQWQLRLHWSQSKEKSSKLIPLDFSPAWPSYGGPIPVHRQQYSGLGCPLAGINCIWHLVPEPIPTTHQCPGASSHMAWPKSFQPESGECEGCSHVRQHVSGCLPEKSGGHQIARNERFSHRHMWAEKRGMTLIPRHLPGHLNVLADHLFRRNPQDRMEPKPDRSRQDFSCLGQTVRGSVRPREKHEIGKVRLPHSGGDVMESGQSRPELGRPVRLCVPSDKPDKGLSKQGQNRKRRDHPDSARLAQSGVVPGPIRSHDRLSNNSPTSAETAQADLLTPLSSASMESQPSRLEVIKGFHKERGFSEAVAYIKARYISETILSGGLRILSGRCSESGAMLRN